MTADAIREAMARAAALAAMPVGAAAGDEPSGAEMQRAHAMMDAALSTLPVTAAQLAEITRLRAEVATLTEERDSARIWRDATEADMANHTATVEAIFAENAALRTAIQRHRDNNWGSGRVGHVEDALLYAVLVQDADA